MNKGRKTRGKKVHPFIQSSAVNRLREITLKPEMPPSRKIGRDRAFVGQKRRAARHCDYWPIENHPFRKNRLFTVSTFPSGLISLLIEFLRIPIRGKHAEKS